MQPSFDREIIVDLFAGGGGTSTGIEMALGFPPDFACNHDPVALAMHAANHPLTVHLSKDVWRLDPLKEIPAGPIGLLWMSPDCRHFSKAAGRSLRNRKVRDLAWVARTMLMFGLGSALPFLFLGTLTREALLRWRNRLMSVPPSLMGEW